MAILSGINVLSLETSVSGPFCSELLGDFGAEVTKIEIPGKGDIARHWDTVAKGQSGYFVCLNRNKKSIELDLKSQKGQNLMEKLLSRADVFIQNYRPEAIQRLGLSYDSVKKINPKIIYCGISGYGKDGPYKNEPAYDLLIQAEAGLISVTGYEDRPAKIGVSICDTVTGLYSALAISLAIVKRDRTGRGSEIDMSMLECASSLLLSYPMYYWYRGVKPKRQGMKHALIAPSGPYLTKDSEYVVISVDRDEEWNRLCLDVFQRKDLANDPIFKTNERRLANRKQLEKILERTFSQHSQSEWLRKLRSSNIASGTLNDIDKVVDHPQLRYRKFVRSVPTEVGKVKCFRNPITFANDPEPLLRRVPWLGQDTKRVSASVSAAKGRPVRS